jgi:hypothetical protein
MVGSRYSDNPDAGSASRPPHPEIRRAEDIAPTLKGAQGPLRVANLET